MGKNGQIKFYKLGDFYTVNKQHGPIAHWNPTSLNSTLFLFYLNICVESVKIFMYLFTLSLIKLKTKDLMTFVGFFASNLKFFHDGRCQSFASSHFDFLPPKHLTLKEIWKSKDTTLLWNNEHVLNLDCGDVCVNTLRRTGLYALNGWVLWELNLNTYV